MTQKTLPTEVPVDEFLSTLDPRRAAEGAELVEIYRRATGAEPVMWGPSIVGFGTYRYQYASGTEGIWPRTGFSPRKAKLTLYGLTEHPDAPALLARLGPHSASVACVYVNRLEQLDLEVLDELIALGWTVTADSAV
ncbi:DUF1801 domain-containing protein [Microcella sp.]|uniref:DUF1801 domain-containing protein n=1 Tax=Microcella sp. TaxID=1913979 RepID=UPI002567073B|nr:DUF1801 domain-containing protein [Microcella sp.]MBX9472434.1 DUF1801 domain-containing protein [Microcella sp.]